MLVCTYEDRPSALVGLKLLLLSLRRHCPDIPAVVCAPPMDERARKWCAQFKNVRLDDHACGRATGWNVKPSLLLSLLDQGHEEVVWLDSDIVLTADFRPLLYGCSRESLVVSQAQYWDICQQGSARTRLWGMPVGRSLPFVISSGFVRVTPHHRPLLEAWRELLRNPAYLSAQRRHLYQRPVHMLGDQDVLTALVASQQFADIPLVYLRRGRDIILSVGPAGYTLGERFAALGRDLAPLIHCGGTKPWDMPAAPAAGESIKWRYERAYVETSPYGWAARQYADELDEPMAGLRFDTATGKLCKALTGDHPVLVGLPQAIFHTVMRRLKHMCGITAWPNEQANVDAEVSPSRGRHSMGVVLEGAEGSA
jgi:hypothetical protein